MASGLSIALQTGKTSLLTREKEMAIIGNNIARANQTSYHRQTVNVQSNIMVLGNGGYYGTGVHVEKITRNYNSALESSLRLSQSQTEYSQAYYEKLSNIEGVMGPQGVNHLSNSIQDFADSIQGATSNPESISDRNALLGATSTMADSFNQQYENLRKLKISLADTTTGDGAIKDKVNDLNTLVALIPQLNDQIRDLEMNAFRKQKANDLRDDRDEVISKISELIDIHVSEGSDYRYTIRIGDSSGQVLIDAESAASSTNTLTDSLQVTMVSDVPQMQWATATITGNTVGEQVDDDLTYGEIKGLIDARVYIDTEMTKLHTFALEIATQMNTIHNGGLDLDDNAGGNLFSSPATPPASGNILTSLITDPRDIALNGGAAGDYGDGSNGITLWTELDTANATLSNTSILNYGERLLGDVAQDVQLSYYSTEASNASRSMYQNAVFELSAVNMDEEMTEMLEVQRAYQATAKFMAVVNEMLTSVLTLG